MMGALCVLKNQGDSMMRFSVACVLLAAGVGCGGKVKTDAKVKLDVSVKAKAKKPAKAEPAPTDTVPASPNIAVTNNLAEECMLKLRDTTRTPKFDYDEFGLEDLDRSVLDSVATCLVSGPLTGRSIQLVGRADPRGTEEYNLALGNKRATTVAEYLRKIGVSGNQITTTTRGALDAEGKTEQAWKNDRRVDIVLMEDLQVFRTYSEDRAVRLAAQVPTR